MLSHSNYKSVALLCMCFPCSCSSVHSDPTGPVGVRRSNSGFPLWSYRLSSACHSLDTQRWDDLMDLYFSHFWRVVCFLLPWFCLLLSNWQSIDLIQRFVTFLPILSHSLYPLNTIKPTFTCIHFSITFKICFSYL